MSKFGEFAFAFNGNITISTEEYDVDTLYIKDYFLKADSNKYRSFEAILISFMKECDRAYSMIVYHNDCVYLMRDRYGVRPLMYYFKSNNIIIGSECVELDSNDANINLVNNDGVNGVNDGVEKSQQAYTDVKAGEIIRIKDFKLESIYTFEGKTNIGNCLFEYIYFMNKTTTWNSINVEEVRGKYGEKLAQIENEQCILNNKKDYIVVGIPKSGIPSAKSYASTLGIEYKQFITKNKNIYRTFILDTDAERKNVANQKYIFDENIKNSRLIIFDDSVVRGITMETLVKSLKEFGALEVHVRISSPQIKYTCEYGIDIPTRNELLMNKYDSIENAVNYLGCDSLTFLDLNNLSSCMSNFITLCTGCFNNDYKELEW
jgi:amidophosphoribosyltransferase